MGGTWTLWARASRRTRNAVEIALGRLCVAVEIVLGRPAAASVAMPPVLEHPDVFYGAPRRFVLSALV